MITNKNTKAKKRVYKNIHFTLSPSKTQNWLPEIALKP
jgi:hypothetical protein